MSWSVHAPIFSPPPSYSTFNPHLPHPRDDFGSVPGPSTRNTGKTGYEASQWARSTLHPPSAQQPSIVPFERIPGCLSAPATPRAIRRSLAQPDAPLSSPPASTSYKTPDRPPMSASTFAHLKLNGLPPIDMESDRLARACGQGPSFSLVSPRAEPARGTPHWEDSSAALLGRPAREPSSNGSYVWDHPELSASYGVRPRARSVRVPQRTSPTHVPSRPRSTSQPASIPVFSPSSPRSVLWSLRSTLDQEGVQLDDCLDVQHVVERWSVQQRRPSQFGPDPLGGDCKTFGTPVSVAVRCASMATALGGFQHHVPWVVYACVEELNRTGIYQPGLFRAVPHRTRLAKLVSNFDLPLPPAAVSTTNYAAVTAAEDHPCPPVIPTPSITRASLRKESMADICALLKTYLDVLPEPLLDENLTAALHRLCVLPSLLQTDAETDASEGSEQAASSPLSPHGHAQQTHARARSAPPLSFPSPAALLMTPGEQRFAAESRQIVVAQHLLRLAPPPLASLFAYLLAFFTQLPLSPDNGITLEDVACMFGRALAAGASSMRHAVLMWLLERWVRISDGLFEVGGDREEEDGRVGEDVESRAFGECSPRMPPPPSSLTPRQSRSGASSRCASPCSAVGSGSGAAKGYAFFARPHSASISSDGGGSVTSLSTGESEEPSLGVRTPFGEPGCLLDVQARARTAFDYDEDGFSFSGITSRLFAAHEKAGSAHSNGSSPPESEYDGTSSWHSRPGSGSGGSRGSRGSGPGSGSGGSSRCSPRPQSHGTAFEF